MRKPPPKVGILPKDFGSLAGGIPPAEPGTLFVMGSNGGMCVAPDAGFNVMFGRCEPDVHVCVGGDDPHVSRQHGYITREHSRWVLHNVGKLAIRLPGVPLVLGGHQAELPMVYTPLFIVAPKQEHLLEVRIAAGTPSPSLANRPEVRTYDQAVRDLSPNERLVLVCLAQRYLRREPWPQPLTWTQVADELTQLRPAERWNAKRAARVVTEVRRRLSAEVPGLLEEQLQPPLGNALNHNLITDLLLTGTIVTSDLWLIDQV